MCASEQYKEDISLCVMVKDFISNIKSYKSIRKRKCAESHNVYEVNPSPPVEAGGFPDDILLYSFWEFVWCFPSSRKPSAAVFLPISFIPPMNRPQVHDISTILPPPNIISIGKSQ